MKDDFFNELHKIIDREVKAVKLDTLRPDDWTVERMMKEYDLTEQPARRILNKLTEQGYFIRVSIPNPNGGGARKAYRPVENKKG